ncbi:MAG: hypothetical protein ACFE0I_15975 [Elainellaceae cyanobacterium]
MTLILLLGLIGSCLTLLLWGFKDKKNLLQYPFLAAAVFSGWVIPQFIGLSINSLSLPPGAINKALFMTLLCVWSCWIGHSLNKRPFNALNWPFSHRRLLIAAAISSLAGSYFFYQVSLLSPDAGTRWSGPITIFAFFSSLLTFGLVLAIVSHIHKPSQWSLMIIGYNLIFYFDRIVMQGRRRSAIELLIIIGLALWFRYRKLPPRAFIAGILVIGTLWINSIGDYRSVVIGEDFSGLSAATQIDYVGNLREIFTKGGLELRNATYNIEAFDRRGNFDFGLSHWNSFIRLYVPGQWIGEDTKQGLMLPQDPAALLEFGHIPHTGTTHTGMSDAFESFWYFGAVKFLLIAYLMRSFSRAANQGHFIAQVLLMLVFAGALESITHSTDRFFMTWPKIVAFLGPALLYAKVKKAKVLGLYRSM